MKNCRNFIHNVINTIMTKTTAVIKLYIAYLLFIEES